MSREESLELLRALPVAHLGVIDDGEPYVTPMSFVLDGREMILFRTMPGRKLDAIRRNDRVCVEASVFDEETGAWSSVIILGRAREVEDDTLKSETVSLLFAKYEKVMGSPLSRDGGIRALPGFPNVVQVEIDQISGMTSGRGFAARTRPGRL